jgi:phosphoribosylformimino-5-aminoimidazole carboxamide ribotide isomerase
MQIIPAIDIIGGKCVRLSEGKFDSRKEYGIDAAEMARQFGQAGAQFLHIVDLEGAKAGRIENWTAIEGIGKIEELRFQVGGGVRSETDVERLLGLGAQRVVIGSLAISSPEKLKRWAERFGPEQFCIAVDIKNGELAFAGWQRTVPIQLDTFIAEMLTSGFTSFLSTDVHRDGMMGGPNLDMYRNFVHTYPNAQWLASGGVDSVNNLQLLKRTGVAGAVIGKAFYEGTLQFEECVRSVC